MLATFKAAALAGGAAACSFSFETNDGARHIVGPVMVSELAAAGPPSDCPAAGPLVAPLGVRAVGLFLHRADTASVAGLGYADFRTAALASTPLERVGQDCDATVAARPLRTRIGLYTRIERDEAAASAGLVSSVSTIGVAVSTQRDETAFSIGFQASEFVELADDVLVLGNPAQALDRVLSGDGGAAPD